MASNKSHASTRRVSHPPVAFVLTLTCGLVFALMVGTSLPASEARADTRHTSMRDFLNALRIVETGGSVNPAAAVGDNGRSIGPYQIQKPYWIDANVPGDYQDVRRLEYAERVMLAYWARYVPEALERLDFETLARVHNGGPRGHHKQATIKYWKRVQQLLK